MALSDEIQFLRDQILADLRPLMIIIQIQRSLGGWSTKSFRLVTHSLTEI